MLVPDMAPNGPDWLTGSDEVIATPGALTSGFSSSEIGVGPPEEKLAIVSESVVAATVIASGELAGELIDPYPYWSNWLSPAITGTTPA